MTADTARRSLAALRLSFLAVWLAPRLTAKIFGLSPDECPGMTMLSRLIATREATLGAILLRSEAADAARQIDVVAAASTADLVGIGLLWRSGDIGARTAGLGLTTIIAQLTLAVTYRTSRANTDGVLTPYFP